MFSHTVNTERTEGVEKVLLSYSWPERPGNCCKKNGVNGNTTACGK